MPSTRVLVATLGAGAALLLGGCGSSQGSTEPAALANGVGTTLDRPLPHSIASLRLRNSHGHTVTLGSFAGRTLVISDSMTLCSEDCPLDTANIVAAARAADAAGLTKRTEFLSITIDPARDTPHRLAAYRRLYDRAGKLPNWQLLTGSKTNIAQLWHYLGVWHHRVPERNPPARDWLTGKPLKFDVAHSDQVIVFDDHQHERVVMSGHAYVPHSAAVPPRLRAFLSKLGHRHLDSPGPDSWTAQDVEAAVGWLAGARISGT